MENKELKEDLGASFGPGSHPSGHAAFGVDGASRFDPSRGVPSFEECAALIASYIVRNQWADANYYATANQRAYGFCEYKLLDRAKEIAAHDSGRFEDVSGAYQVVAEMLEYFDSYQLATWAPLAAIIERERTRDRDGGSAGNSEGGSTAKQRQPGPCEDTASPNPARPPS
jgi:hypothetical protein